MTRFLAAFLLLLVFDALAQVGFKMLALQGAPLDFTLGTLARMASGPWPVIVVTCFVGAFVVYTQLIQEAAVGPLFAASHLDIVVVALVSLVVFDESFTPVQVAGCAVIALGALLLGWSESRERPGPAGS